MLVKLKEIVSGHTLILAYLIVFLGLLYGVFVTSGTQYFGSLGIYLSALILFYVLFSIPGFRNKVFGRLNYSWFLKTNFSIYWLLVPMLLVIIAHLVSLGGIPALIALKFNYIEEVGMYRNSIFYDKPAWIGYPTSIVLKSALPFALLYAFWKKKWKMYWILFIIGLIYTFALMQKSFIVGFLLPAMIFAITQRKFLMVIKYIGAIVLVVFGLTAIQNPAGGSSPVPLSQSVPQDVEPQVRVTETAEYSKVELIIIGLTDRLFVVPGQVVSDWFSVVPSKKPFLYGDGYRLVAMIRGREFHNYAKELYPVIQTEFAAMGLTGSVNAASFMYEYANFGNPGMVLSGFILALLLAWLEFFFKGDLKMKLSLCVFPILLLSSCAITTLLFSGGLGFSILFYFLYIKNREHQ